MVSGPTGHTLQIYVSSSSHSQPELHAFATSRLQFEGLAFELKSTTAHGGISDPAVLVATVTATSAVVSALITGLLQLAREGKQKILLQGKSGQKLEIPADTPPERIAELVAVVQQLDVERIRLQG